MAALNKLRFFKSHLFYLYHCVYYYCTLEQRQKRRGIRIEKARSLHIYIYIYTVLNFALCNHKISDETMHHARVFGF